MSTLPVVERILRTAATPLTSHDIVRLAGVSLPTRSKVPTAVVARDLAMDIKRHGTASRFVRVSLGVFTLRELAPEVEGVQIERPARTWSWTLEARRRETLRRARLRTPAAKPRSAGRVTSS